MRRRISLTASSGGAQLPPDADFANVANLPSQPSSLRALACVSAVTALAAADGGGSPEATVRGLAVISDGAPSSSSNTSRSQ